MTLMRNTYKPLFIFSNAEVDNMSYCASYQCVECYDIITNPICPSCLTKEMKIVVGEKDPVLAKQIDPCSIDGDSQCLSCGGKMGLCAHCFCKDVYEKLVLYINLFLVRIFL